MRRGSRRVAAVPDEIFLGLGGIGSVHLPMCRGQHLGPLAIEVDQLPGDGLTFCGVGVQEGGAHRLRSTEASFQPRLKASCMETFMPWPAFGLWVWQASPAMNTLGSALDLFFGHVIELVAKPLADLIDRPPGNLLHLERIRLENAPRLRDQIVGRDVAI